MNVLKSYKALDRFLKMQLLVGFFYSITWCLFIPLVHKMQGEILSVTVISIYLLTTRISGLLIPFFKGKSLKTWVFLLLVNTFLYIFALPFYYINRELFLYFEMIVSITSGILYPLLSISWDLHVVRKYDKEVFEEYRYLEQFRSSLGGIIGYGLVVLLSSRLEENDIITVFCYFILFCLLYEIYNYKVNYYKKEF